MKIKILLIALAFAKLLDVSSVATTIAFTSPGLQNATTSSGAYLDSSYTFALGTFSSGFTPTISNVSLWQSNFNTVFATPWMDDSEDSGFAGTGSYQGVYAGDYTGTGATAGQQAYVWGYNTKTLGGETQWVLLSNVNWILPAATTLTTTSFGSGDAGTFAIAGFFLGTAKYDGTIYLKTLAVPEPSSVLLLTAGAALLTGTMIRRRKAA